MWWHELKLRHRLAWPLRLAVVLVAGGLTAGCWQPLYGSSKVPGGEGVQDKFASVDIPPIVAPKGTPFERVAVGMFNALQFDLHNGQTVFAPAYKLTVSRLDIAVYLLPRSRHRAAELLDRVGRRQLSADRADHRQDGRSTTLPMPMSVTTSPVRSSASPDSGRGATPRIAPSWSRPTRSGTGWRRISWLELRLLIGRHART